MVAALVLVLLILAVLIAARLLSTRFAWRRVRRRLAAGTAAEQVTGAWAWTRMRLEACRLPLGVDVSPDVVVATRARLAAKLKLVAEELANHGYPTDDVLDRRLHAAAGARGGDDDSSLCTRAVAGRCRCRRRVGGGR